MLVRVREDLPDRLDGVCSRCMMKALCLGVCRVEAYVTRGDFYAPNWFCDQALREGFFPNARLIESGRKKRPAPSTGQ